MGERKHSSKAFLPITRRIRAAIAQTVDAEQAQATKEGMPKSVFLWDVVSFVSLCSTCSNVSGLDVRSRVMSAKQPEDLLLHGTC
jgi:hypothetical protein